MTSLEKQEIEQEPVETGKNKTLFEVFQKNKPVMKVKKKNQPSNPPRDTMGEQAEKLPIQKPRKTAKDELINPNKDLSNVPSTLEKALAFDEHGSKNSNEVLGVLVAAHQTEAMAILERTHLRRDEVVTVANCFNLAKHGIGGTIQEFNQPMPQVSEWALNILKGLPSVDGESRKEFVEAWGNSRAERLRQEAEAEKRRNQFAGA